MLLEIIKYASYFTYSIFISFMMTVCFAGTAAAFVTTNTNLYKLVFAYAVLFLTFAAAPYIIN